MPSRRLLVLLSAALAGPLALPSPALAKDPCKEATTTVDAFSGATIRSMKALGFDKTVAQRHYAHWLVARDGEVRRLTLTLELVGAFKDGLPAGTPITLATAAGPLELETAAAAPPRLSERMHAPITVWDVPLVVTDAALAALAASPLVAVRVPVGGQPVELRVEAAPGEALSQAVRCVFPAP